MRKSSRVITYSKLKLENEFLQNWNIDYQCGEYLSSVSNINLLDIKKFKLIHK